MGAFVYQNRRDILQSVGSGQIKLLRTRPKRVPESSRIVSSSFWNFFGLELNWNQLCALYALGIGDRDYRNSVDSSAVWALMGIAETRHEASFSFNKYEAGGCRRGEGRVDAEIEGYLASLGQVVDE